MKTRHAFNKFHTMLTGGFTLVELLIAAALTGIFLAALYRVFIVQRQSYSLQNDTAEMQQSARGSEQMVVREIRMAGYALQEVTVPCDVAEISSADGTMDAFEEATAQSVAFTSDVDSDGIMETIRYSLRGLSLVRQMWRWNDSQGVWKRCGGARALCDQIDQLHFSYWILADRTGLNNNQDDDGDSFVDEPGELLFCSQADDEERQYIRMVQMTITARAPRPDPHYQHPVYGDHYRRMTLTSTIRPRNAGL